MMKDEYLKVNKNLVLGAELMQITYAGQRQEIKNDIHIKDVIERYPFLQNYEEVNVVHERHTYITWQIKAVSFTCMHYVLINP